MSIVGPRPRPRPHLLRSRAADTLFWEVNERYWHRHSAMQPYRHAAKPGLTGLAQVRCFGGATVYVDDPRN